jgi:uncharacterized membrane protein (GlpM family)
MLTLKLLLVPLFLLVVSIASQRLGPRVAGWMAALPVVAGPLLLILAVERGARFAAAAATAAAAAVLASVSFALTFAHTCQRLPLSFSVPLALLAWVITAYLLVAWSPQPALGLSVGAATALLAPRLYPTSRVEHAAWRLSRFDLLLRMAAGAVLTLLVAVAASTLGPSWAGVLAVFPILSLVLAVFSYRRAGAQFTIALLHAMAAGLYSFVAFCGTLAFALPRLTTAEAFGSALLVCLGVQRVTQRWLSPH